MTRPQRAIPPVVDDALLGRVRTYLAEHNWLVVHIPHDAMCHTVGLTSYGLPELVVLGQSDDQLNLQLDRWAARLVAGELPFGHAITVHDLELREHTFPARPYDVTTRGGLWVARALYGPRLRVCELAVRHCRCLPCQAGLYTGQQEPGNRS